MHRRTPANLRLPPIQKTSFLPTFTSILPPRGCRLSRSGPLSLLIIRSQYLSLTAWPTLRHNPFLATINHPLLLFPPLAFSKLLAVSVYVPKSPRWMHLFHFPFLFRCIVIYAFNLVLAGFLRSTIVRI